MRMSEARKRGHSPIDGEPIPPPPEPEPMLCEACGSELWTDAGYKPCPCVVSRWMLEQSAVPRRYMSARLDATPCSVSQRAAFAMGRRFVAQFEPHMNGLYLFGLTGTGKTYCASAICNELLRTTRTSIAFWSVSDLLYDVKAAISRGEYGSLVDRLTAEAQSTQLIVLDDLGSERPTEFAAETLSTLIRRRDNTGRPLIITSNYPLDPSQYCKTALSSVLDPRLVSRLRQMVTQVVLIGDDQRAKGRKAA